MKPSVYLLIPLLLLVLLSGKGQNSDYYSAYAPSIADANSGIPNGSNSAFDVIESPCVASAGKLKPYRQVCYDGITSPYIAAVTEVAPIVPLGFKVFYVLSSGPDMVIDKAISPEFLLDPRYIDYFGVEAGLYRIHTLVYNPVDTDLRYKLVQYGKTRIADIHQLLIQGGGQLCGALDLNGAVFNVPACTCPAKAGTLDGIDFFENYPCLNAGSARLRANVGTPSVVPVGYQLRYILSKEDSLVVSQVKEVPDFTVTTGGRYRIHTLVYHISSLNPRDIRTGVTSVRDIYDRISQGNTNACGSINVKGNLFFDVKPCVPVCSAAAGTLKIKSQTCVSNIAALIQATTLQAPVVPAGFKVTYVLTSTDNLVIQKIESFAPEFKVNTPGRYRIHTLVYNPATFDFSGIIYGVTQVSVITKQLIQGGGVNCGAWDGNGVVFDVTSCPCGSTISAGRLKPRTQVCDDGSFSARLSVIFDVAPVVPEGFKLFYVLTSGENSVLVDIRSTPNNIDNTFLFVVNSGLWRVHTLVLNLADPELQSILHIDGEKTIADIYKYLIQGGGKLCGDLDLKGAVFNVGNCVCPAKAGTLKRGNVQPCLNLSIGSTWLRAEVEIPSVVPPGYLLSYVLTEGDQLVVRQVSDSPNFLVTKTGAYQIHPLVYHPNSFNVKSIKPGITTALDIRDQIIEVNNPICGSINLRGFYINLEACTCPINSGYLVAENKTPCISTDSIKLFAFGSYSGSAPKGFIIRYVLTRNEDLTILKISPIPTFFVAQPARYRIHTLIYDSTTLNLSSIVFGVSKASTIYNQFSQGGGVICGKFDVQGAVFDVTSCPCEPKPKAGKLKLPTQEFCNAENDLLISPILVKALVDVPPIIPSGFRLVYILSFGEGLIKQQIIKPEEFDYKGYFSLDINSGKWRIHPFVYNPGDPIWNDIFSYYNRISIADIQKLLIQGGGQFCGDLDLTGAEFNVITCNCQAKAGVLIGGNSNLCLETGSVRLRASEYLRSIVPEGYQLRYVLTESIQFIVRQIKDVADFTVTKKGYYAIHVLVYHPSLINLNAIQPGVTTIFDIRDRFFGTNSPYCGSIEINGATFVIGDCPIAPNCSLPYSSLSLLDQTCLPAGGKAHLLATPNIWPSIPENFQRRFVLTSGENLIIQNISTSPDFQVSTAGRYRIHTLTYDPTTLDLSGLIYGITPAAEIVDQLIDEGKGGKICGIWDRGVVFDVLNCINCAAYAGIFKPNKDYCLYKNYALLVAGKEKSPFIPDGFQLRFVLSKGNNMAIKAVGYLPEFYVDAAGTWRIHAVVYNPIAFKWDEIISNVTSIQTLKELLARTYACYSLDEQGAVFEVTACLPCNASAGKLKLKEQTCIGNFGAMLQASILQAPVVPPGFKVTYVLSSTDEVIIQKIESFAPEFKVNTAGRYRIHTLVYNPATFDFSEIIEGVSQVSVITKQLFQGGGINCGDWDVDGVVFDVINCSQPCSASAGTLKPGSQTCWSKEDQTSGMITALVDIPPIIPAGFQRRYILTQTYQGNLFIGRISETPTFQGLLGENIRIHTLVYNPADPEFSNLNGYRNLADIYKLLIQGGGKRCGALDLTGAAFNIPICPCAAKAGTLVAVDRPCLNAGLASIRANVGTPSVVPQGFQLFYLLTEGDLLVIRQIGTKPVFPVTTAGRYRVHTMVYHPNTFNPSTFIQLGVTKAYDIQKLLIEGGSTYCGSINLDSPVFTVSTCVPACTVSAGTLIPQNQPCLVNLGKVTVKATFGKQPNIPPGYFTLYLLTSGDNKVIENVTDRPSFDVYQPGKYRIHTLLYLPNSLSFTIYLSETPLSELNALLIQGGGKVCAALDLSGALFEINYCGSGLRKSSDVTLNANDKNEGEKPFTYAYPNPTKDRIRLIFNGLKQKDGNGFYVEILNVNGNILNREKFDAGTSEGELDLKSLPAGIYYIRVMRSGEAPELIRISKL